MAGEVGFERLAVAMEALAAALPAVRPVDAAPSIVVSDVESRRLLEQLLVVAIDVRDELRTLNARSPS